MRRGLIADRDQLRRLRDRLDRAPFDRIHQLLRNRCAMILQTAPITQATWQMSWARGLWSSAVLAARTAQGRMLDLLIADHIEPNAAFRSRAIEELRDLVAWSTWRDPGYQDLQADLCTAEAAVGAAVALDWLWEDLSQADRDKVMRAIMTKAIEPYLQAVDSGAWWYRCYHSWNAVCNAGCGLAALALSEENPSAARAYRLAREGLAPFLGALGKEGGWDEGTGYWGYAMRYVLLLAEAAGRLDNDQRLFHARGMDATGLFPIYFTPNGHPVSFGDGATAPLYGSLYLLSGRLGRRETAWWLDTYAFHEDVQTAGWSSVGLAMIFRPDEPTPKRVELEPAKAFAQIGWAAMADRWPRPGLYAALKTGDLSASHSQRDMNALQVQVDAETLLSDSGSPPYSYAYLHGERSGFYHNQAQAHNTVTVGGRDHLLDARGEIVAARAGTDFRLLVGRAGNALGDDVRFVRSALMLLDRKTGAAQAIVVLDELTSGGPETVQLYWHTYGRVEFQAAQNAGLITGQNSRLYFALGSTSRLGVSLGTAPANHDHQVIVGQAGIVERLVLATVLSRVALGPVTCAWARAGDDAGGGKRDAGGGASRLGAGLVVSAGPLDVRYKPGREGTLEYASFKVHK